MRTEHRLTFILLMHKIFLITCGGSAEEGIWTQET